MRKIILASASLRRIELLKKHGLSFEVVVSGADENIKNFSDSTDYVLKASLQKAASVFDKLYGQMINKSDDTIIIAADTAVVLDNEIYGKPESIDHAYQMLNSLSGREHKVVTGVTIVHASNGIGMFKQAYEQTTVKFKKLSDREIKDYLSLGEYADKAGGYAIQGNAAAFVEQIDGDMENVIGLPTNKVLQLL